MAAENKQEPEKSEHKGVSDEDAQKESSKVAKQAAEAHDKATELLHAAAAAGDPEERQKLMEQALEQQIQSKSLGKTAKYLQSGTFQGMAVGAGLGIAPGASLGAITGTLVGGVTSTALGGLGAGIGAATGALHGPFWDMQKGAGKGIQKITGLLPGWKATESQKKQLEKMVGQINEQDAPSKDELDSWSVSDDQKEAFGKLQSKLPSMPATRDESSEKEGKGDDLSKQSNPEGSVPAQSEDSSPSDQQDTNRIDQKTDPKEAVDAQSKDLHTGKEGRKKPRKLQSGSNNESAPAAHSNNSRKQPRKLEKRSA
ncbi:hypothetical protein C7974DRAFT_200669 [Boeremia exigua]|uniref:uncharacterized protein n=1 Tax=Boeremia exigua TaxID=749465 RepID=UPI001E8DBF13|nr:uncharacterized protein C7974DRAFT_200669 [Boeremia exigua]KAH6625387.1 hypothetical protein C7974DRAFT_200669 [Boeremia exigua]